jgi:hypothetical protein
MVSKKVLAVGNSIPSGSRSLKPSARQSSSAVRRFRRTCQHLSNLADAEIVPLELIEDRTSHPRRKSFQRKRPSQLMSHPHTKLTAKCSKPIQTDPRRHSGVC